VPRISPPALNGNLDAWPKEAADLFADTGAELASHIFFPTSWFGPDDPSARVRLGHDGEHLYLGIEVRDNLREQRDTATVWSAKNPVFSWQAEEVAPDIRWQVCAPEDRHRSQGTGEAGFACTCLRTQTGHLIEGSVPLSGIGSAPGKAVGFLLQVSDRDNMKNLAHQKDVERPWAQKQVLVFPYYPNFTTWKDARNCVRLVS